MDVRRVFTETQDYVAGPRWHGQGMNEDEREWARAGEYQGKRPLAK